MSSEKSILVQDLHYIHANLDTKRKLENTTIIITGCAGFLGFYFLQYFCHFHEELKIKKIIGLDNFMLRRPQWIDDLIQKYPEKLDVRTFDIIKDDLTIADEITGPIYTIHLASIASPTFYRKYPFETIDANVDGLRNLCDKLKEKELKGLLYFSSSEIYGDPTPESIPTDEEYRGNTATIGPRACYDESKRFCETLCYLYSSQNKLPITIVRPFNNYGPGMDIHDKRLPADLAKNIINGNDITILSDGTPTRTFCYISDAILGYLKALLYAEFDYFNIGIDKPEITVKELALLYQKAGQDIFGYKGNVTFGSSEQSEYLTHNPNRRCPIIDKAKDRLNYHPSIHVEEGVTRYLTFLKETSAS